jgi:hypothetical protein
MSKAARRQGLLNSSKGIGALAARACHIQPDGVLDLCMEMCERASLFFERFTSLLHSSNLVAEEIMICPTTPSIPRTNSTDYKICVPVPPVIWDFSIEYL